MERQRGTRTFGVATVALLIVGGLLVASGPSPQAAAPGVAATGSRAAQAELLAAKLGGSSTPSFYAHWVAGDAQESFSEGERRGCRVGERNPRGPVVLAFGRQVPGGATAFSGSVRSFATLEAASAGFARGLAACGKGPYLLALATSNHRTDEYADAAASGTSNGTQWAQFVTAVAARTALEAPAVVLAGGNDIEPSWGPADYALAWVDAFAASGLAYVFVGSADGCPWTDSQAGCNNGWSSAQVAHAAWPSANSFALPQVYDATGRMAAQWARLSVLAGRIPLGVLVQAAACRNSDDATCAQLANSSPAALTQINALLPTPLTVASNISWN